MHFPENAQVAFLVMSDVFLALLELEDWLCDLNPHPKEVVNESSPESKNLVEVFAKGWVHDQVYPFCAVHTKA